MQLQQNYDSDTVTHMFNIQNRPKTKYFYHSFLEFYIKPSDPKEYVWFLPYITVINALFLRTFPLNLCDFCTRIEVQVTSFNIQWCIWAIQMLLKNSHSTKWTNMPWPYQKQSGVHITWRVHITWIYPMSFFAKVLQNKIFQWEFT